MLSPERLSKMWAAAEFLGEPGTEVVRELVDELTAAQKRIATLEKHERRVMWMGMQYGLLPEVIDAAMEAQAE